MEMVKMDRFGRILLPKKVRDELQSDKFMVEFKENEVVMKPIPSFFDLMGKFPSIDMAAFRKQHEEDKGKND